MEIDTSSFEGDSPIGDDVCEFCGGDDGLVLCDYCYRRWHRGCHPTPITDEEMGEEFSWTCHWCRRDDKCYLNSKLTDLKPKLTKHGHLLGCLGRYKPNKKRDSKLKCCAWVKGEPCGLQASTQSCLWYDQEGTLCYWCVVHWRMYCDRRGHDDDLSHCANIVADHLNEEERESINEFDIQERLRLPMVSGNPPRPTNHLSAKRQKRTRYAEKAERGRRDRERIDADAARERRQNELRLANAKSNLGFWPHHSLSDDSSDNDFNPLVPDKMELDSPRGFFGEVKEEEVIDLEDSDESRLFDELFRNKAHTSRKRPREETEEPSERESKRPRLLPNM